MNMKLAGEAIMSGAISACTLAVAGTLFIFAMHSVQSAESRKNTWEGSPVPIILDQSILVQCGRIDRSHPSCTLISKCDDGVDRCVTSYEIIRQDELPAADMQPAGQSK